MVDSTLFSLATLNAHPAMNPDSVIQGDHWRIGLITDALVRFEWSDSGRFVDDATQMAMVRDFGEKPEFTVTERNGWLEIDTPSLHISYNQRKFSPEGLYATVKHVNAIENTWHYGDVQRRNLGGTYRTLDEANGRIPVDPGVNSTDGWAIIDDSKSNVIRETAEVNGNHNDFGTWVTPKEEPTTDLYLFGYGHRYREAVHALYRLTGPTPLLPRFVLGNWWSRYHRYTETEYRQLVERFEKEGIPFTTAVIDMDWHLVDDVDPKYGSGWTGYTWNKDFFPDPKRFLNWLHEHGMKATLNVHPRDGVRAFEELYPQVAKAMNIDPESGEAVQFDLTDPKFMEVYFDQLHHPMEEDGVDFWWIDWQQGGLTRQPGLDPLWGLNHLHYLDSARNDGSDYSERNPRPLTFSRYAGPGSHRYPIGFSGDTVVTWESLKFQPEFTACASNIGYGWWSHDIGGHMFGYRNEELEARWYQLGAFSPINRLHSSNSPFSGKEPWNFNRDVSAAMVDALRLRHAMMPYLYTMNYRAAEAGRPLVEPMYWQNPDTPDAYEVPDEFRFGTELVVAPIVSPDDAAACRGRADAWLPQGEWFDFFDGRRYVSSDAAGRRLEVWRSLDRTPVFAKAGAIVPLQDVAESGEAVNSIANPQALRVLVFPGADGSFVMREDRGTWGATSADTAIAFTWGGADASPSAFTVAPVTGDTSAVPELRDWTVVFRGVAPVDAASGVRAWSGEAPVEATVAYDEATMSLTVSVTGISSAASLRIEIPGGLRIADNPVESDAMDLLLHAQMLYRTKELALQAVHKLGIGAIGALRTMNRGPRYANDFWITDMPDAVAGALEEILLRS